VIEFGFDETAGENAFDLGGKCQPGSASIRPACIVKRLDADPIANQVQRALSIVPQRKREHAVQTIETRCSPFSPGVQKDFGIGVSAKLMTLCGEFVAQFSIVVNLAIENHDEAVVRDHRLMSRAAGVDNGQTPMTETDALTLLVDRRGRPHTFVVTAAMFDGLQHRASARLGVPVN